MGQLLQVQSFNSNVVTSYMLDEPTIPLYISLKCDCFNTGCVKVIFTLVIFFFRDRV